MCRASLLCRAGGEYEFTAKDRDSQEKEGAIT